MRSDRQKAWQKKAAAKGAIVPRYFQVSISQVMLLCGKCGRQFKRNLISNQDEPTFICPDPDCKSRNWVPVTYCKEFPFRNPR